jgi:alcohol dehydrogenase
MPMPASSTAELRKFLAPEFIFGIGARHQAGRVARNLGGTRALIVTDPGIRRAGWVKDVADSLAGAGLECELYDQVTPNPRDGEVMSGAARYADAACDVIVAVGGGSPMDCAKGIGIVTTGRRSILDFEGVDQVDAPMPPLVCVPTTGGTSADVSQFAIITDTERRTKIAVISKAVVPDVSLIDPETLTTMDPYLTACTAIDALVHAIEAFVSNGSSPITDLHALEAIRLVKSNIEPLMATPDDLGLRSRIMQGSLQAGLAFSNASLGANHAMAHSLGGWLDLPHGECNAVLLEHVVAFNHDAAPERFKVLAESFGIDVRGMTDAERRSAMFDEIRRLRRAVGIDRTLGQTGVDRTDVSDLARNAMLDPCMVTNPRRPGLRDIEVLYEEAL